MKSISKIPKGANMLTGTFNPKKASIVLHRKKVTQSVPKIYYRRALA